MTTRQWIIVLTVALTLVVVSSAKPFVQGFVEKLGDLPLSVVVLGMTSCFMLLISLLMFCRTWVVRKSLVLLLARFGTPTPVIARSVNLPQDGVAFLTDRSGGKHGPSVGNIFRQR